LTLSVSDEGYSNLLTLSVPRNKHNYWESTVKNMWLNWNKNMEIKM
jgi:hypothetical protein